MLEKQTRNLRKVAIGAAIYSAAAVGLVTWPASGWIGAVMAGLYVMRKRQMGGGLTSHGSAKWATRSDLRRAGMLNAKSGLILGRAPKTRELIRLPQAVHNVIFAPSGAGKTTSGIIPYLLQSPESAVVVDYKGELYRETASHRQQMFGHEIVVLDPFRTVTDNPDTFNPIDQIEKDDPKGIDDCNDLANAIVVRTGEEKDPHWNDSAQFSIGAIAAAVVACGDKNAGTRSIQMVRKTLSNPNDLDAALGAMKELGNWNGALAQLAWQFSHFAGNERASVLTSVNRHLSFLGSPTVMASTEGTSFDPKLLRKGKMTIYLIIPPERAATLAGLLRMWISSLMRVCVREQGSKVDFLIDEAATVGQMDAVTNVLNWGRSFGLSMTLVFQNTAQAQKNFPQGQHQSVFANAAQIFFAVNDNDTANYVSAALGDHTIVVKDTGSNTGSSRGSNEGGRDSSRNAGSSAGSNVNFKATQRRLLKPEEVRALPQRTAITFVPGMPPICTTLLRHYEEKWMRRPNQSSGKLGDVFRYVRAGFMCVALVVAAIALTPGAFRALHVLMGK